MCVRSDRCVKFDIGDVVIVDQRKSNFFGFMGKIVGFSGAGYYLIAGLPVAFEDCQLLLLNSSFRNADEYKFLVEEFLK